MRPTFSHRPLRELIVGALALACLAGCASGARPTPDAAIECDSCAAWNGPREPFRVFGNTYYVGTAELSSILVVGSAGHVLIDGGLPQSAPEIAAHVAKLGFRLADVRVILSSHTHFDHAGGIAALQRASGATVVASPASARALERGGPTPDDPQFALDGRFPAIPAVHSLADGEQVRLGDLVLVPHSTPGHTPGGTTWTWRSCAAERCLDMVYADSLTAISAPGFHFAAVGSGPAPGEVLRQSIATIAALPCDLLLTPHPGANGLDEKLERRARRPEPDPFIDPDACRAYAAHAEQGLDARLRREAAGEE